MKGVGSQYKWNETIRTNVDNKSDSVDNRFVKLTIALTTGFYCA